MIDSLTAEGHGPRDTLLCNAHATAADVLWQGVPIVTLPGATFTQRVATSLLTAADAAVFVASSEHEYVGLAVTLATQPLVYASAREQLRRAVDVAPLFDTRQHVRALETGIAMAWDAWVAHGGRPQHVVLAARPESPAVDRGEGRL